jgi:hypothetical protein
MGTLGPAVFVIQNAGVYLISFGVNNILTDYAEAFVQVNASTVAASFVVGYGDGSIPYSLVGSATVSLLGFDSVSLVTNGLSSFLALKPNGPATAYWLSIIQIS